MTIIEKLALKNSKELHLYKEGVFWVAYEEDAYRVSLVKTLKPTKKYIKSIQQEVVSVGFPPASLDTILSNFAVTEKSETLIVAAVDTPVDDEAFARWKNTLEIRKTDAPAINSPRENGIRDNFSDKLSSFKLHQASPMDCMRFIEELQEEFC